MHTEAHAHIYIDIHVHMNLYLWNPKKISRVTFLVAKIVNWLLCRRIFWTGMRRSISCGVAGVPEACVVLAEHFARTSSIFRANAVVATGKRALFAPRPGERALIPVKSDCPWRRKKLPRSDELPDSGRESGHNKTNFLRSRDRSFFFRCPEAGSGNGRRTRTRNRIN